MEKAVRASLLALLVLAAAGVANASWTTTVYTTSMSSDVATKPPFDTPYQWGSGGVGWGYTVQWDHEWMIPSDPDFVSVDLIDADLKIKATYASGKTETIHLGSKTNPSLGGLENGENPFDVLPFEDLLDGDVTVYAKLFTKCPDDYGTIILNWSKLGLTYEITKRVWVDDPEPVVPAPAAAVLCSLGAGLVGWLRRRGIM